MANAKNELLEKLNQSTGIKCALIKYRESFGGDGAKTIVLKLNHSKEDYINFLKELDFEYDNGYGGQELDGTVWLQDGTWLSRGEYDGSEWWEHNRLPPIPNECN